MAGKNNLPTAHRVVEILGTIRCCRRQEPGRWILDVHARPVKKGEQKIWGKYVSFMKNMRTYGEKHGENMSFEAEWQVSDINKWDRHEVSQDDDATSAKVAWTPRFQQRMRNDHLDMAHCYQRICNSWWTLQVLPCLGWWLSPGKNMPMPIIIPFVVRPAMEAVHTVFCSSRCWWWHSSGGIPVVKWGSVVRDGSKKNLARLRNELIVIL